MHYSRYSLTLLLSLLSFASIAQTIHGKVCDTAHNPIPFATIKYGNSDHGTVAGLDGSFAISVTDIGSASFLEISSLGYKPEKMMLPAKDLSVVLHVDDNSLHEVIVKPPYDKIKRILNNAISHKNLNDPDKYDWYQCHVYYKMLADVTVPDSLLGDTSKDGKAALFFLTSQHALMSETYSIRTWKKPQHLQEQVIATRFSGLKKSPFVSLVTDELPFHAYTDYLTMNGKDYHNPVSRGFEQYYRFNLLDELVNGQDTVWALSFKPHGNKANDLTGTVYINSDGYAISHIIAKANDTVLKMSVRIEQEYNQVAVNDSEKRWFPLHLNYIIDWMQQQSKNDAGITFHMKGNSSIDSVTWKEDEHFKFDKAHTVKLADKADELPDTTWRTTRPLALDAKEARTYQFDDSIGVAVHADMFMEYLRKLPEGKIPIGPLDVDLKRIFTYNQYEQIRLGMGLQTNEHVVRWLSIGGWAGYGFKDEHWKYGAFAEVYADKEREFVFRASYTDDLNDPGRIHLNHDLDKSYLNYYLLQRVDETKTTTLSLRKRINYWNAELAARQQQITPKYTYALNYEGESLQTFTANEASLSLRYAYAERTAPMFGHYYSLGSKYPIWYGKLTTGMLGSPQDAGVQIPYTQAVSAVVWHKHINRLGFEHFFMEAGKSWSDKTLPLSKLFAGNGYEYGNNGALNNSLYTFGGMMTMYPYRYYTDEFVNVIIRHDFDWKLYHLSPANHVISSAPNICLQYDMLYGTMAHPQAQQWVSFAVPYTGYHEAGVLLNNFIRYKYFNIYYVTLNIGYFYHIAPVPLSHADQNGHLAFGIGYEL